jgi:hypothetical protein
MEAPQASAEEVPEVEADAAPAEEAAPEAESPVEEPSES